MENATNVSQKKCNATVKRDENTLSEKEAKESLPEEELIKKIRNGKKCPAEELIHLIKKKHVNLRIAYGVYLSMCQKNKIDKVITWRTFYMQCSGYRTLKPHTMKALSEYIRMQIKWM